MLATTATVITHAIKPAGRNLFEHIANFDVVMNTGTSALQGITSSTSIRLSSGGVKSMQTRNFQSTTLGFGPTQNFATASKMDPRPEHNSAEKDNFKNHKKPNYVQSKADDQLKNMDSNESTEENKENFTRNAEDREELNSNPVLSEAKKKWQSEHKIEPTSGDSDNMAPPK